MATIPPPEGEEPVMPEATPKAPSPLSFPDFRYFWLARFTAVMATIAMVVVIGYQLYDTARSDYGMSIKEASFQLGLLGLFQFVPLAILTPVAGWAADRFERRRVAIFSNLIDLLIAARPKSNGKVSPSVQVNQPSVAAIRRSMRFEKIATLRRSKRSAAHPATGVRIASGTNWNSPSSPSWNDASLIDMP